MSDFNLHKWFKNQYLQENDDPKIGSELEAGLFGTGVAESEASNNLVPLILNAIDQVDETLHYGDFAKAIATILKDEYGSHNFEKFMDVLHAELGMGESLNEVADDFYPDSPEALSAATAKAREILDKHKASIKAIADKYEGQANKSREMMDELNALIDADLEGVPFQDYVSNKVRATLGKALFRYYASKNPELAKIMK